MPLLSLAGLSAFCYLINTNRDHYQSHPLFICHNSSILRASSGHSATQAWQPLQFVGSDTSITSESRSKTCLGQMYAQALQLVHFFLSITGKNMFGAFANNLIGSLPCKFSIIPVLACHDQQYPMGKFRFLISLGKCVSPD